jgi:predicted DNA-binding transcriptional regulator AlpA
MARIKNVAFDVASDPRSGLLPDPLVADRYQVSSRTIDYWDRKADLGFPRPIRINNRKYRRLSELEAWERNRAAP